MEIGRGKVMECFGSARWVKLTVLGEMEFDLMIGFGAVSDLCVVWLVLDVSV